MFGPWSEIGGSKKSLAVELGSTVTEALRLSA
jgi:hypothetical protein